MFSGRRLWLAVLLIAVVGLVTFSGSITAPFIFDDPATVSENPTIRSLWLGLTTTPSGGVPTAGRPLANFSFAVNYAIGGLDVRGYHAVDIAVHVACALLLFGVVRRTLDGQRVGAGLRAGPGRPHRAAPTVDDRDSLDVALVCALVWMVHPLQTEAVDYISARTESLMALFYLSTLYCSIRGWSAAAIAACAAGMACKESMASAPLIVALYDRVFVFSSWRDAVRARGKFYAGLAASWVVLAALVAAAPRGSSAGLATDAGLVAPVSPFVYLLNQAVMIVRYLRLTFWPDALVLDYGVPRTLTLVQVLPQLTLVVLLGAAVIVALKRAPSVGFLGAWFFMALAPSSSFVPVHTEVGAERRMYLASMAIVILVVIAFRRWIAKPAARIAVSVVVIAALAAASVARTREYASALTMWQTVVERWPNGRARWSLAEELKAAGRGNEALPLLREAVADFPDAHRGVGEALFADKRYAEAVDELDQFIRLRPRHVNVIDAHELAGRALAAQGKTQEAIERFRTILAMVPSYAQAHGRIADVYFQQQRFADAVPEYAAFLAARSGEAGPWTNYAISLFQIGRLEEAVNAFERAAALEPQNKGAQENLANAKRALNDERRAR